MKKRKLLGQNGITLVEIIIVIAIIGILASTSVMMIGHLHYANTQKVVRTLDSSLDALQVRTMSKAGSSYLYIYKLDNGYYTRVLSDNLGSFDDTKLTSDGTKLVLNIQIRTASFAHRPDLKHIQQRIPSIPYHLLRIGIVQMPDHHDRRACKNANNRNNDNDFNERNSILPQKFSFLHWHTPYPFFFQLS